MKNLTLTAPLEMWDDGTIRVEGSRVTLDSVVHQFKLGSTAEQIQEDFPTLDLRRVYAVLAFYLDQREFVEEYLQKQDAIAREAVEMIEGNLPSGDLRASIRARQRDLISR